MGTITKHRTDTIIDAEGLGLDDPTYRQHNALTGVGNALWESKRLEELINDADSQIGALVYFFFGSEGEQHAALGNNSAAIPKLTH